MVTPSKQEKAAFITTKGGIAVGVITAAATLTGVYLTGNATRNASKATAEAADRQTKAQLQASTEEFLRPQQQIAYAKIYQDGILFSQREIDFVRTAQDPDSESLFNVQAEYLAVQRVNKAFDTDVSSVAIIGSHTAERYAADLAKRASSIEDSLQILVGHLNGASVRKASPEGTPPSQQPTEEETITRVGKTLNADLEAAIDDLKKFTAQTRKDLGVD